MNKAPKKTFIDSLLPVRGKGSIIKLGWVLAAGWTLLILAVLALNLWQASTHINQQARLALQKTVERDLVFRRWAAGHEGVYVEVTPETPPSPYLETIEERDIQTPSGRNLTLMNPAYMMRQVYNLGKEEHGVYGRIISLNPLSTDNAPDPWEEEALRSFPAGVADAALIPEATTAAVIDGRRTLRLVRPFYTEESCLACHSHQGYRVGDLQGGISVAASLVPYLAQLSSRQLSLGAGYGLIWLVGLAGILWSSRRLDSAVQTQQESEGKYKSLVAEMDQGMAIHEMIYDKDGSPVDYRFIDVNRGFEKHTGLKREDIVGKSVLEILPGTESYWIEKYHQVVQTGKALQYQNYSRELGRYYHVIAFRPKPGQFAVIATDITQLKQVEARLKQEEHVKEVILSSMADKVVFHDKDMRIRWANQAACSFFGLEGEELAGERCHEILDRRSEDCQSCPVKTCIETGEFHQETLEFPEGKTMLISAYPVWNDEGRLDGVVEVSRDITERARMMEELKDAKETSEAASTAKSHFLANMSHEIRTPLNVIMGMANLASEKAHNREQKEYLGMIVESAASLLSLINDILDFSKIGAQKLELVQVPLNLSGEIGKLVLSLTPQAYKKGLELEFEIDRRIPKVLLGDPTRLHQVMLNLIGNAIKFTKEGSITVELRLEEISEEEGMARVLFSVRDTGIGIAPDKMEGLFEVFVQVHDQKPYDYEGTGLGLPIAKSLVELMGGTMGVESQAGRGSTFYFTLPFPLPGEEAPALPGPSRAASAREKETGAQRMGGEGSGLNILLVEDKPMNQRLATIYLERMGHQVTPAHNGKEAVKLCSSQRFDLILMDVHMPEMDGLEATSHIRADEAGKNRRTPILAMTAYALEGDREKCLQAGMDGYLSKPMNPAQLHTAIVKAVRDREEAVSGEKEEEEMLNRLGGNKKLLEELVELFLQDYRRDAARLKEGLENRDITSLDFIAHGMKGELGNLGFMSGYRIALQLEERVKQGDFPAAAAKLRELEKSIRILEKILDRD